MKWNVDHLPAFVAVADHGGISAAARQLGAPKSTVSRAVARLEEDVGLQLFVRGAKSLRLTHDGSQFYQHAIRILEQVEAASAELAGLNESPRGRLTVALPMAFGREIVAPRLNSFRDAYPEIRLDLRIGSGRPDLLRDAVDLAVVVGAVADSDLVQQKLIETPLIWIASPDVAAKLPASPDPVLLASLIGIVESRYADAPLAIRDVRGDTAHQVTLDTARLMQVNDPILVRDMVRAGGGLSFAPDIYCRSGLADGSLVQIYPDVRIEHQSSLLLLYPGRRLLPKKTRVFIDFLHEICTRRRRVI
jgi:DNA-binding transcriptional LysR family regulator